MKATAVLLAAVFMSGCSRLFLHPSRQADPRFAPAMKAAGLYYEEVSFKSGDGKTLSGLFIPASTGPALGTIVHFHGNAENMTTHVFFVAWLAKEGFNVFAFDYRGYGASSGPASVKGAVKDGVAAIGYVAGRADVDPHRIVAIGQSLGGALAVTATARSRPDLVKAVVVESAFGSYREIARDKLRLLHLSPLARLFGDGLSADRYAPELGGRSLLVIHGDRDQIVPISECERLYAAARGPKELWRIAGGGHTEAFTRYSEEYRPKLVKYLTGVLAP